jgi:hypothetical protein
MVCVTVLVASGEIREGKLTGADVSAAAVARVLRKTKQPTVIGSWVWNELRVAVWGWRETAKGAAENKHDLPAPADEETLWGDAVVVAVGAEDAALVDFPEDQWLAFLEDMAAADEGGESSDDEEEADEADEADAEVESNEEEDEAEEEEEEEAEAEEEAGEDEEEEGGDDDCFDDGDDGGGKRRAPRRRTVAAPEYRRLEMGLRSRIRLPAPVGKRAPRWQTAPELTAESYSTA